MFTYVDINVFYSPLKTDKSPVSVVNGIVHFKMKIMSSFTHPQIVSNLYECLSSAEHRKIF